MSPVSVQLRDLVKQRLAAAAEDIFELVERTIIGYEQETERQRTLLEYLLLPRVQLHRVEGPSEPARIKEEQQEPPGIKQEQDIIITELCSGPKTEELISASSWEPNAPQTQAYMGRCVSESSWVSFQSEEEPLTPTQTEEEPLSPTQTEEEPLTPTLAEEEPLSPTLAEEEPLSPTLAEEEPLTFTQTEEEPLSPTQTEEELLSPIQTKDEPLEEPLTHIEEEPLTQTKEKPLTRSQTKKEPLTLTLTEEKLPTHSKTNPPKFVCSLCSTVFKLKSMLLNHMRLYHVDRPFRCSVCGKGFIRKEHLKRHFLSVHSRDPTEGALSLSNEHLRRHCCAFCSKRFESKSALKRHMIVHTGEKPYKCSVCGTRFTQKSSLKVHLRDFHPGVASENESTAARAPLDGSTASVRANAAAQRRLPHNKRPAESSSGQKPQEYSKCLTCGKFVQTKILSRHLRIHTGEKPFKCSVCGNSFIRKDGLQAHMLVHSKERPFTCSICGIKTKRSVDLRNHMAIRHRLPAGGSKVSTGARRAPAGGSKVSTGARRAPAGGSKTPAGGRNKKPCPICGKVVTHLNLHLRTHTGERPFSCSVCGKKFATKKNLQRHKLIHTRIRPVSPERQNGNQPESSIIYCRIDD